ncbi:hypothetical protein F7725_004732 [Dissostichus mawsoni]|uniref:Uncharacterized protein n=1 Tax=Dissostichus mawsoni TaxID=36200 RepID=A0A7J5XM88_DISMA|nr:hypothetical protein F7725_004732 [Dissostichus mawsoni]
MFLYHPETGSTYLANMAKPRARHCMEILGERLYVAGGITSDDNMSMVDLLTCEVYNPVADSWTAFTSLSVPHVSAGGAVLGGKLYVLGGYSHEDFSETKLVHRYDPTTKRWENMGKMPGPNSDIRASVLCLPPHFRMEDKKSTEGCVSIHVVEHSAVIPQFHVHLVTTIQLQNNSITATVRAVR